MKYVFTEKSRTQIKKLQSAEKKKIERVLQYISKAETITDIPNTMKVKGTQSPMYRIKVTPHRVFFVEVSKIINIISVERRNEGTYKSI